MHIKLISPQMTLRPMDSEFKPVLSPSLSLLVVAALTPPEHTVEIADENTSRLRFDDHPGLVGINVNVDTSTRAYEIAQQYHRRGVPVVLGGIHASANPREGLRFADAVCIGEAETLWKNILKRMPAARTSRGPYLLFNLGYRKYGKIAALLAHRLGFMSLYGRLARHLPYGI